MKSKVKGESVKRLTDILLKFGVGLLVAIALFVSALRLVFPYLNDFRESLIQHIETVTGQPVKFSYIEGEWRSFGPALKIDNVQLKNTEFNLNVDEVTLELDVWRSLLNFRWQFRDLTFHRLNLAIAENENKDDDGDFQIKPGSIGDVFLRQLNYFDLKESKISFFSPSGTPVALYIPQLTWLNKRSRHQAEGNVYLSGWDRDYGSLNVILDLSDNKSGLLNEGTIYLQANSVDVKPWLSRWVRANTGINNADFSLASWIQIKEGQIGESYLQLKEGNINWFTEDEPHQLNVKDQLFHLTQQGAGWQLDAAKLEIVSDGQQWLKPSVSLYWQPEDTANSQTQDEILRIRATRLQLDYLKPILPIFTFLNPEKLQPFLDLDPKGFLSALALDIPLKQPEKAKFIARWQDVSWQPWSKLPGIEHFDGHAEGNLSAGYIQTNLTDSILPYEQVFKAPLEVKTASGQLYWSNNESGWKLWSKALDVQAKALWVNGDFSFSSSEEQGSWLSILAGIHTDDAKEAWRYYPQPLMGEALVEYLTGAIQGGEAQDATLIFEGDPKQFPYKKRDGKFEVFVPLRNATLQFQPNWQPVTQLTANLDFVNDGLWIKADDARLADVVTPRILAAIPVYQDQKLYLTADIQGTGSEVYTYLNDSPLRNSVAAALEQVQISGEVSGNLRLTIPLNKESMVEASGHIQLDKNDILIKPVNLMLEQASGRFDFTNETLTSQTISANWFNQPVSLNFKTQNYENRYQIDVDLGGKWSLSKLPVFTDKGELKQFANDFRGNANWQSHIGINLPHKGTSQYQVALNGNISNVSEHLSSVLGNKKGQPIAINLQAKGTPAQLNVSGSLANNKLNSRWLLGNGRVQLEQAALERNSKAIPALPKEKTLKLDLSTVNGDYWLPLITTLASNTNDSASSKSNGVAFSFPNDMTLTSPSLQFIGQYWRDVDVNIKQSATAMLVNVKGKELTAALNAPKNGPWKLAINHLYYNPLWASDDTSQAKTKTNSTSKQSLFNMDTKQDMPIASFRKWPAVAIECNDCWFMGQSFGYLGATIEPDGNQLKLTQGLIDIGNTQLNISGYWQSSLRGASSAFKGTLTGKAFDKSVRHFGIVTPLHNAPFSSTFDLNWAGEPWKPQINTLSGTIESDFQQGYVANMGGGTAGQILRFVSVTALLRKLQFDFNDSFSDNFDFDNIMIRSKINNGVVDLERFWIKGLSADIAMDGQFDLVKQTMNMEAVVAPEISTAAGVAVAVAVNPVAGVAVYAASKVLAPLWGKVSFIRYQITGSFDNPNVSEIFRQDNEEK